MFPYNTQLLAVSAQSEIINYSTSSSAEINRYAHHTQPSLIKGVHTKKGYIITLSPHREEGGILKTRNPNIPQAGILSYYDKIFPSLTKAEKQQYGLSN